MDFLTVIGIIAGVIIVISVVIYFISGDRNSQDEERERRLAGKRGEKVVTDEIKRVKRKDDYLFTNVKISFKGKRTECDNIIVNNFGVFIIEVKNYSGSLSGNENDDEWGERKYDDYGNIIEEKNVKNPIKQVRRQIDILSKRLKNNGLRAWIDGYVIFIHDNSPVNSKYIISLDDIDRVIHTQGKNKLTNEQVEKISGVIQSLADEKDE